MSWVRPLRITTPEGDTIHGAQWPDHRVFAWPEHDTAEAWMDSLDFDAVMTERGWTVDYAPEASA